MEPPPKKKGKKGFADTFLTGKIGRQVSTIPSVSSTTTSKKAKVKLNNEENSKKKMKKNKTESHENRKVEDYSDNIQDKPIHTENLNQKAAVCKSSYKPKKQARSLTDQEYDDLFMAVLQDVMKAESEDNDAENLGDMDTAQEKDEDKKVGISTDNTDKGLALGESSDDADDSKPCEVIRVELLEEHDLQFDRVDEEDIDNWNKQDHTEDIPRTHVETLQYDTSSQVVPSSPRTKTSTKRSSDVNSAEHQSSSTDLLMKKKTFSVPEKPTHAIKEKKKHKKTSKGENPNHSHTKEAPTSEKLSTKQKMTERELEDLGTWVQCGNTHCLKWRYLADVTDPMEIPDRWECNMNTNKSCNSCSQPEEAYDESEHIYTKYTEGSVVLARMPGYPWWPAMVEIDPDFDTYFEVVVPSSMYPTKYHVVFFDKNVSRAWISVYALKPFQDIENLPRKHNGHNYTREVNTAIENAQAALELSIKERLKKFSFAARFSGKWGHSGEKKSQKQRKHNPGVPQRRRQQKRKPDLEEERLFDKDTLSEILNSQSMFSDVDEILSSLTSGLLDDGDSSFHSGTPCSHRKRIKLEPVNSEDNRSQKSVEAQEMLDEPTKLEFDSDIFTMDTSSQDVTSTNQMLTMKNENGYTTEKKYDPECGSLKSEADEGNIERCLQIDEAMTNDDGLDNCLEEKAMELDKTDKPGVPVKLEGCSGDDANPSKPAVSSQDNDGQVNGVEKARKKAQKKKANKKEVTESVAQGDPTLEGRKNKSGSSDKDTGPRKELKPNRIKKMDVKGGMKKVAETEKEDNLQLSECERKQNTNKEGSVETKSQTGENKTKSKAGNRKSKSFLKSSVEEKESKSKSSEEIKGKKKKCKKSTVEVDISLQNKQDRLKHDQIKEKPKEDSMKKKKTPLMASTSQSSQKKDGTVRTEICNQQQTKGEQKNITSLDVDHDTDKDSSQQPTKSQKRKDKFHVKQKKLGTHSSDEIDSVVSSVNKPEINDGDSDDFMLDFDIPADGNVTSTQKSSIVTSTANGEDSEPLDFEE